MDGIEIRVTGATPLEVLARIGAFGMHCLANADVGAAARRIYDAEAVKEKAAQLDAAQKPQESPTPAAPTPPVTPTFIPAPTPGPMVVPRVVPMAQTAPQGMPAQPATQVSATAPIPSQNALSGQTVIASPSNALAMPAAPTATPTYSLDDLTRAGADFIVNNPDKQELLNSLFPRFGITTLAELRPDQMGPFATAMRAMGVNI